MLAGVKKSKETGLKTYFYKDALNNEVIIASYIMKTPFMNKTKAKAVADQNLSHVPMGEGQHAIVFTRYNPNSVIVRKQFTSNYGDPLNPCRLNTLISLHTNQKFRELNLARFICLPFQVNIKPNCIHMKKVPGASLEELSKSGQVIEITKHQVVSLLNAIIQLADQENLRIVHTDIHAGNIMRTDDLGLVLIDFDECISTVDKFIPRMLLNEAYIGSPNSDDYLNGYDDDGTPQFIPALMTCEEEDFYQAKGSYDYFRGKSIQKYKDLFLKNEKTLFNDQRFLQTDDSDNFSMFQVQIKPRKFDSDSEEF